jgi:hypothetical protein
MKHFPIVHVDSSPSRSAQLPPERKFSGNAADLYWNMIAADFQARQGVKSVAVMRLRLGLQEELD